MQNVSVSWDVQGDEREITERTRVLGEFGVQLDAELNTDIQTHAS